MTSLRHSSKTQESPARIACLLFEWSCTPAQEHPHLHRGSAITLRRRCGRQDYWVLAVVSVSDRSSPVPSVVRPGRPRLTRSSAGGVAPALPWCFPVYSKLTIKILGRSKYWVDGHRYQSNSFVRHRMYLRSTRHPITRPVTAMGTSAQTGQWLPVESAILFGFMGPR